MIIVLKGPKKIIPRGVFYPNMLRQIITELNNLANPEKEKVFVRFFKTGKGEYGEGDKFLGLTVPQTRAISKKYFETLNLHDIQKLLKSKIHEYRLSALMMLRMQYESSFAKAPADRKKYVNFFLKNTKYINNWDLVDLSCQYIVGNWLLDKDRALLYRLAKSKNLWERRIAIISTGAFIGNNQFEVTLKISEMLLKDKHDLIHKAVGWMLRELGKRNQNLLKKFLKKHSQKIPRTMLRYAIERFSPEKKKFYLNLT